MDCAKGKARLTATKRQSAEVWRGLIEEWQQSGVEFIQFCHEKGIPPSKLKWWRWRLGIPPGIPPEKKVYKQPEHVRQRVRARQAQRRALSRQKQPTKGWIIRLDGSFFLAFGPENKRKCGPDGMRKTENVEEARRYESEFAARAALKATRGVEYQEAQLLFCDDAGKLFRSVLVEVE